MAKKATQPKATENTTEAKTVEAKTEKAPRKKKAKWTVVVYRASGKKTKLSFGNNPFSSLIAQASFLAVKDEIDKLQGSQVDSRMGILGMKVDLVKEMVLFDAEGGRQDCADWEVK